jgi:transcriptional regulator with XRE-family HTH domain
MQSVMPSTTHLNIVPRPESADAILAKNLVTARLAVGLTQQRLAEDSGISRATVVQIEAGSSDPRLSTIIELAKALGLPAILLLVGLPEIQALSRVLERKAKQRPSIDPRDVERMTHFLRTGMLRDRARAAMLGATAAESFSKSELSRVLAAMFSGFLPGAGTEIGALLGELFAEGLSEQKQVETPPTLVALEQ